ncbi:P-loop NTPase [Sphingomonas solaris]|uniref:P-loop NTPase n=1 Tax=Alterirhizorhabdus solaris TaxID=2529389 RepID=UPI00139676CF|nr:P-loop NTPase [Sphingomonas solaris]
MSESARNVRVVALASGKGGVGKTSISVNLAVALAREGQRTMLVDTDFGLANAAVMLGVNPPDTIEDVLEGRLPVEAAMHVTGDGLRLLPGASGVLADTAPLETANRRLAEGLRRQSETLDFVIVDSPSGVQPQTMRYLAMSDRVLLVLTAEPTSFMDAYATVKLLSLDHGYTAVSVISNMVDSEASGRDLFGRFHDVASRFLPADLRYLGSLPRDEHMRMAIMRKQPCVTAFPESRATAGLARLAQALAAHDIPPSSGGSRFLGLEHLDGVA